ncbi:hypothetical protein PT974_11158 [Cladobotryum mycophilum]|uniref:Uncharacterized protein n=1 Tax=Cladobotryum mycophilum TaxID=491253 RepID=A0ABR0S4E8_9HYPO
MLFSKATVALAFLASYVVAIPLPAEDVIGPDSIHVENCGPPGFKRDDRPNPIGIEGCISSA